MAGLGRQCNARVVFGNEVQNLFDTLSIKLGKLQQSLKEVEEVVALMKLKVLDLKRECKNYLQTILRLSQENEYLKTLTHQADSPPSTSLLNEELKSRLIVSATDSVVTCGIDQSLNECCGDGSESSENGLTVATLQDRVCNSNKEHQSQHNLGTNSCQHQKEDSQQTKHLHCVSSMKFIKGIGEGHNGTVTMVEVEGVPCIAKRPLHTLNPAPQYHQPVRNVFERECVVLARLHHPNIIQFMGVCCSADSRDLTLIMEYMPIDLDKVIVACHGHFPLSLQLSILLDVSLGMQYLHAKGIVHCDLTPDNILLSSALDAKIGDLGCTHILGSKDMSGYPQDLNPRYWAYMPPQVFNINFKYTEKLDVFSFGALTLFVATQTFPERYMGSEVSEGARERNEVEIERHRSISTILDKENCLLFMIRKCLRDKEEDRPTSNEVTRCMKHWARTHPKKLEDVVLVNNQLQNKLMTTSSRISASLAADDEFN